MANRRTRKTLRTEMLEARNLFAADGLPPLLTGYSAEVITGAIVESGETAVFRASGLDSSDGTTPAQVIWDFGDGTTGTGPIVEHSFPSHGRYVISATIIDEDNIPVQQFSVVEVLPVIFELKASYTDDPLTWTFDTVSGEPAFLGIDSHFGTTTLSHSFASPGVYQLITFPGQTVVIPFIAGNDAPLPNVGPLNTVTEGQNVALSFVAGGGLSSSYQVRVEWGDGQEVTLFINGFTNAFNLDHSYDFSGDYTIRVSVTAGELTDSSETQIHLSSLFLLDGQLMIGGTLTDDSVQLIRQGANIVVISNADTATFRWRDLVSISALLYDGNDVLTTQGRIPVPIYASGGVGNDLIMGGIMDDILNGDEGDDTLFGDNGDDFIWGGSGIDLIFGGDGDDVLAGNEDNDAIFGENGDDLLIGGLGSDVLVGGNGDDLIIGGTVIYEYGDAASLSLIRDVWRGPGSFARRTNQIRTGTGRILDGTGVRLQLGAEVFDDEAADIIIDLRGNGWVIAS